MTTQNNMCFFRETANANNMVCREHPAWVKQLIITIIIIIDSVANLTTQTCNILTFLSSKKFRKAFVCFSFYTSNLKRNTNCSSYQNITI